MNLAHLHLLLNHFPTIGTIVGVGLFVISLLWRNEHVKKASLGLFVIIALICIPAYLTGRAAQDSVSENPEVTDILIRNHQDEALIAFVFMQLTGIVSWIGLWQYRRLARMQAWNLAAVLLLSITTFALMARAANLGGEIRHPEIRTGVESQASEEPAP